MGKIKLLVNMDTPIEIESSSKDLLPLHERITMIFHPFETSSENLAKFPDISTSATANWGQFSYNYPTTGAATAWSFIPTASQIEIFEGVYRFQNSTNGYIKVEIPTSYNSNNYEQVLRFTERIEFIYEASDSHQQLKRKHIPSKNTQNTKKSLPGCMRDGSNPDLTTTPSPPNIVKISIYAPQILSAIVTHDQPDLISYKLTDKRTYTFNNNSVNVTTPFTGMPIDNFLKEKAGLNDYKEFNDFQIGGYVISFTPSTNTLVVGRETTTGYLTENSSLEPIVEFRNNSIVHDEYRFRLIRSPNFTFDNQIVNPVLVGIASPYDAIKREIILKIKKGTAASNYILLASTPSTANKGSLIRSNGVTSDIIEDNITISVTTPDYHESSSFEHLMDGTATQLTIASNNTTSSPNNGDEVMALLINRYPRYGLNYQINYSQATRKDQGIYDEYEHAVLQNSTYPVINDMQNIIVNNKSTFNVIYPASKPSSFAGTPVSTGSSTDPNNSYEDYPVYYEASLTFKNQQTNNPVKLTARYNYEKPPGGGGEYELQKKGGHNLKHGMLLVYGTDEINENTTQTTIRNGNTVVDLIDSKYGEKLVIKFIPGSDSKFAYDSTSSNEKPTFYFKDISVTAGIDFGDREKKNLTGGSLSSPEHYYTNLLTNDGNVVPPFDTALLYDSNYTQDTDGNTPDISGNPVLKATYTAPLSGAAAFWTKTVELGFNQDIYDELTSVGLNISKGTSSYTYTSSVTNDKITLTMNNLDDVTTQDVTANNISAVYNNPTAETGSYPFTNKLYNWFGFEIGSFNSQLVNDSNLESLPTIAFGNIGGTLSDFSVPDSQLFENNYSGILAWHVSNHASFSASGGHRFKYYIQISEEDSATGSFSTWTNFGPSVGGTTSYELSTYITGLNYNKYYKFRVRGKSYDFGEWTVISDIHSIETITPYAASNKNATPSAPIAKFEWTTPDTSIDTYKIQLTKKFYSSGDPDFTDLSGTILLTNQSGTTTNFSLNATDFTTSGGTGYFNPDDEFQTRIIGTKDDSSPYTGYHWVSQDDAVTIHDASSNILSFRAHKDDRLYNAIDISFTHVNDINDYTVNFYTESAGTYTKIGSRDFSQTGPTQHDNIDTIFTVGSTTGQVLDKLEDSNGLASGGQTIYATIVSKYSIGSRAWEEPEFDSTSNNFGTFTPDSSSLIGTGTGKGVNYTTSPTLSITYNSSGVPQDISVNLIPVVDADIYELRIADNYSYSNTGGDRSNVTENLSTSFNAADWSSPGAGGTTISLEYNKVYYGKYKAGLSSLLTNKFDNFGLRESSDTLLLSKPNIPGNPSSGGTAFNFSATVDNVNSSTQYNDVTVQFDSANDGNNIDKTNNNFKYVLQYGVVSTTATEVDLTPTSGTSYSYSITDLSDNTNYFFKLITRNSTTGLSGTSGTVYGGGDSLAVSASNVSIKSRPITASIDSWKIYEKESGLYTELNKSVAIIDEYVRFNFTTDMDLTTIAVTKVEVTDDSGTATTVSTSSGPNSIPFIITTNIDTTTNRSGYIQLKINPFNEDGFVTFTFNLTNSNSVVAAYTANSNLTTGAITIDSSRPDVQSTSKEWIVKVHNSGSWVAKSNTNGVGNDIKKAFVGEMLELSFTTDDDDLSGNSIPEGIYDVSVNLTENPEIAAPTYILAASQLSSFNTSYIDISYNLAKDGGKIGYIVQDGDYGSVQFKFNLRDENGNIIATKENILSYNSSLSSGLTQYGAYNIDYPNDNNITFDVSLNLSEKFGDVDFILDYNPPKLGTISFRDRATVTDISFCSAVDVSFNSTLNDYIIDSKNTDYVLYAPQISTSGNATVFSGTGEFDKTSYDNGYFYTKNIDGTTSTFGIGGGDKFIETSLFWYKDGEINNYRKIFEETNAESFTLPLNGTATTSKKFTMVRADFPERTSQRNSSGYSNIKNDPYVLKLNNFKQKVNSSNEPIKQFVDDISGALTVITGEYEYPDYLWGSRCLGSTVYSGTTTEPCVAFNGSWPKRRWDLSKNIVEQDITGFAIRASKGGLNTILTFDDTASGINKFIIPTSTTTGASSSVTKTNYTSTDPTSFTLDHVYRMDEMFGTTTPERAYGISGEKIDWEITAISDHTTAFSSWNTNSHWNQQTGNYTTGDKVKQGFIPRTPYYSNNLKDVEIGDNNGGTDIVVTSNSYVSASTMDSSGNVDISFNYWEEGKQLFFPHKEKDALANAVEDSYWFNTTYKFKTDISGATSAFTSGSDGDYRTFDISWNINKNGNYNTVETNDISFNFADLSNNSYYKYSYDIVNTLCITDVSGARFPETVGSYSEFLSNPNRPTVNNWITGNFTTNTLGSIDVDITNKKGVSVPGGGVGTRTQDMRIDTEWVIRNLTVVDGSLNRFSANHLGSTNNEAFGYSVAMSGDGHTLAVGAPYYTFDDSSSTGRRECGRVIIFKWRNKRWEQFNEIIGDLNNSGNYYEYDHFGFSLALNKNGNILVVGAPQDTVKITGSTDTGYVRVYGYKENSNKYEQLGNNISVPSVTHEKFGFCVDISPDGKYLIAGTPNSSISSGDPLGKGVIIYYKLQSDADGGEYLASGSTITFGSDPSGAQISFSNAISNDGKLLAAGAPYWRSSSDNYLSAGKPTATGKVELLRWDPTVPTALNWTTEKIGFISGGDGPKLSEIKGTNITSFVDILEGDSVADSSNNEFGYSIDFANNRLIVGSPAKDNSGNNTNDEGALYIYSCDNSIEWGTDNENKGLYPIELSSVININGSNTDNLRFGSAVSISEDGKTFAVGAPRKGTSSDTEDHGMVQVFTIPDSETITYDIDEMGTSGSGDIGIALTGETLVRLDTIAEKDRPKLIVGNKYIFNVGSNLYDTEDIAFGYYDIQSTAVLEYDIGVTTTDGGGSSGTNSTRLELDLRDGYAIHSKNLVELFLYNSNSSPAIDYDTHLNVGLIEPVQIGNDISGNALSNDYFGSSVKLTSDGKQVIIGGHQSFETYSDIEKGYANVYRYSTYTKKWENISGPFVDVNTNSDISNNGTIEDYYVSYDSINDVLKYGLVSPEEKALEPFSRNNLPVYNSNFKIKVANKNRKVENSNWQYGPSVTIKIANTENEQFHQNGIDWEVKYDTVSNVDFIEVNVNTQNLLGKMYVTSPEPSNLSGILNQFTLDVSYNTWDNSQNITTSPITGTPWANSWQNVSSNVTPDEYSIKGSYQDSASNWVVNKLWDITETQLDYGNIVLRWPVLTYAGSGVTIRESNMWRWQLRLSYQPSSTSSNRIASGFERLTNGEYRYNVGSYKSELQTFSQVTASPVFDTVTSYSNEYDDTLNLINVGYSTQIKDAGATNGDERGPPIDLYQSNYNSPIENEQYIPWGHQAHFILWYPVDISGCIRGATSSTNTLNKNSLANKPTINVSSTMENENRFARIDKDEIRELTINGVDTCIQKAPMAQSKKNMMDLGRGFTCFVNTSANWLESDFDTIQLNNNYGTLLDHTIVSNHGISLSNPSNIFKWKPDFSGFLGDPTSSTTLPASAFNVMYIKDASGNYYNSGLISYSAPVQVGKRGYGGIEDDNFYTSNTISLTGMAAGKPYLKIQIEHDGYKLNPLDGYNADFDDFLKLTHKKNGNIVTAAAEWITTNQIAGLSNTQTLNFSNTESSTGTSYNGLHSTYKIINYIKLKPKGDPSTTAGTYDWSTLDVIEIELQDAANGTYNIRNKFTIGFS